MMDANAFLKRLLLVVSIGALSLVNVASGHGGGHGSGGSGGGGSSGGGHGSGGSAGGGSSSGGHSASASTSGHSASASSGSHSASATSASHSTTASKSTHVAADPVSVSQSAMKNPTFQHVRVFRIFQNQPSTGYTTQYRETNDEDWRRKHQRVFLGFIRY